MSEVIRENMFEWIQRHVGFSTTNKCKTVSFSHTLVHLGTQTSALNYYYYNKKFILIQTHPDFFATTPTFLLFLLAGVQKSRPREGEGEGELYELSNKKRKIDKTAN